MKRLVLAGSLLVLSASALAQEPRAQRGFYVGAAVGQAAFDLSKDDLDDITLFSYSSAGLSVLSASSTFDDSGTSFQGLIGYSFSRYFALEASYVDLGKATYHASGLVDPPGPITSLPSTTAIDFSAKGPAVAAAAFLPLGAHFDLHARLGVLFAKVEEKIAVSLDTLTDGDTLSASSEDPFYGAGVSYLFNDKLSLSLDYTRYQDVGDEDETGEGNIDGFSLGVLYRF